MSAIKGLEWTFNTVASAYEKFRPGYNKELFKMIFDYITLNESCYAAEVGIGGGQATLPFLKTGCHLTAVEYGEEFTKLCKDMIWSIPHRHFIGFRRVSDIQKCFQC